MSHWAKSTDPNQVPIMRALEKVGCTVVDMHAHGRGFPDLVVGRRGETYLLEVKTEDGYLKERQKEWIAAWRGRPVAIVVTIEDALIAVGVKKPYQIVPIKGKVKA